MVVGVTGDGGATPGSNRVATGIVRTATAASWPPRSCSPTNWQPLCCFPQHVFDGSPLVAWIVLGSQGEREGETVNMVATGRKRKKDEERGKVFVRKIQGKRRDSERNQLVVTEKHGARGSC